MADLDLEVKHILDEITVLCRRKAAAVSCGLSMATLDAKIVALMARLRLLEGASDGRI